MFLYLDSDETILELLLSQTAQYHRVLRYKLATEGLLDVEFNAHEHTHLVVAMRLSEKHGHALLLFDFVLIFLFPAKSFGLSHFSEVFTLASPPLV